LETHSNFSEGPNFQYFAYVAFSAFFNRFISDEYLRRAQVYLTEFTSAGGKPFIWASLVMSHLLHAHPFLEYVRACILHKLIGDQPPQTAAEAFDLLKGPICPRASTPA
jgi:hypothetical protein